MPFFEFNQNNSGGSFDVDDNVCHRVVIEADTAAEATAKAEELGCYWNGVANGMDCSCCGDRWYELWGDDDVLKFPLQHGEETFNNVEDYTQMLANRYGGTTPDCRIFYVDGTIKEIFTERE